MFFCSIMLFVLVVFFCSNKCLMSKHYRRAENKRGSALGVCEIGSRLKRWVWNRMSIEN